MTKHVGMYIVDVHGIRTGHNTVGSGCTTTHERNKDRRLKVLNILPRPSAGSAIWRRTGGLESPLRIDNIALDPVMCKAILAVLRWSGWTSALSQSHSSTSAKTCLKMTNTAEAVLVTASAEDANQDDDIHARRVRGQEPGGYKMRWTNTFSQNDIH